MPEPLLCAPFALFDDSLSRPDAARSLLLHGLERTIACAQAGALADAFSAIEAATAAGRHVALEADYELAFWLEPRIGRTPRADPLLRAHVFRRCEILDGDGVARLLDAHVAALPDRDRICGIADVRPAVDETAYRAAVERILAYIAAGDCYQVNHTFPLRLRHYGDPLALYARLRRIQPVRHGALLRLPQRSVLSLSPELFLERRGARLGARPMKGTMPRGGDAETDAARRRALAASDKERAENLMIVDLIRNDLGRIARGGSVRVERLFDIEAYPTVWQMTSTISAQAPGVPLAEVFRALFPCGSVTGAPKLRAMQIIAELEPAARGLYTGALGYLAPGGDFSLNVPIRTLALEADGSGVLGVGSGIVVDSVPAAELAECRLKAQFVTGLDADFRLIETLLLDPAHARVFPLLDDHLQRLAASARHFGFACDRESVRNTLLAHARDSAPTGRQRTRLLLDKRGALDIASTPLPAAADDTEPRVVLAEGRIDSRDLFRYHKTTVRFEYEAELARIAAIPGVFDALFCNERGELCEGARSNVFLEFAGTLHTPPVCAGLLDGVMRRHLLRHPPLPIVERTLWPEDLERAEAIYVANAVRGLRRVGLG